MDTVEFASGETRILAPTPPAYKLPSPDKVETIEARDDVHTDVLEWEYQQSKLEKDNQFLVVAFDSDVHFPFHDVNALNLRYEIYRQANPHLIITGSDAFEFATRSRFEKDFRLPAGKWLSRVRTPYWMHIENLRNVAPNATKIFIEGNHDERAWKALEADENYDILLDYHVQTLRANKEVLWLGTGEDALEVKIADTIIFTHGWKATVHTAKAMLDAFNRQYSVVAGHSHRLDSYTISSKFKVECVISGCGCKLNPPYERRRKKSDWQHGTVIAVIDTVNKLSYIEPVAFHHTEKTISALFRGNIIQIDKIIF